MMIKDILELDSKRTQGEWCLFEDRPEGNCHYAEYKRAIYSTRKGSKYPIAYVRGDSNSVEKNNANAGFIVLAPTMARMLKEQQEALKEALIAMDGCIIMTWDKNENKDFDRGILHAVDNVAESLKPIMEKIEKMVGEDKI